MTILLVRDVALEANKIATLEKSKTNINNSNLKNIVAVYNHHDEKIEYMDIDEYIICVLSAEMPTSYGLEALKAQAVAARTYTIFCVNNGKEKSHNADVCTDYRHCQAYKSQEEIIEVFNNNQRSIVRQAVEETHGQIITYEDEPINALYHASSDSKTESAENVWGNKVEYLVSVETPNENSMPGFNSEVEISIEGFYKKLQNYGIKGDFDSKMIKAVKNESGRVKYVVVGKDQNKELTVDGTELRNIFSLRSCSFDITVSEKNIIFSVRGFGHGVGMSQYGAKMMAQQGKNYKEILLSYYSGCQISELNDDRFF